MTRVKDKHGREAVQAIQVKDRRGHALFQEVLIQTPVLTVLGLAIHTQTHVLVQSPAAADVAQALKAITSHVLNSGQYVVQHVKHVKTVLKTVQQVLAHSHVGMVLSVLGQTIVLHHVQVTAVVVAAALQITQVIEIINKRVKTYSVVPYIAVDLEHVHVQVVLDKQHVPLFAVHRTHVTVHSRVLKKHIQEHVQEHVLLTVTEVFRETQMQTHVLMEVGQAGLIQALVPLLLTHVEQPESVEQSALVLVEATRVGQTSPLALPHLTHVVRQESAKPSIHVHAALMVHGKLSALAHLSLIAVERRESVKI